MKKNNRIIGAILSFCLLFTLVLQIFSPIVSFASEETIYIESAEDFISFAKECSYDAWSKGKSVVLTNDISLEGLDIAPIPSFSGSFNGKNHVINGFRASGAYSPCGLFSSLEEGGVIKNLTVTGSVAPDGDKGVVGGIVGDNSGTVENCIFIGTVMGKSDVGGIVGINQVSGKVSNCKVGGEVIGEERTGGIAGSNLGLLSSCRNNAKVNTISVTPSLSLDQINISLTLDITKLPSLNNLTMTDTGGVSGYSTGMIIGCTNDGQVGYPHVGYNAGGIVGRSCGHLSGNTNNANVFGRKDVGGIVGQMEPDISYNLSEDLLATLKSELDELSSLVGGAADKAEGGVPAVSDRLASILDSIDGATDSLNGLISDTTDYGSDFIGEINRVSEILDETVSQINVITKDIPELTELLGNGLDELAKAIEELEDVASIGADAIYDMLLAARKASEAFDVISEGIKKVDDGISSLRSSLEISDKGAVEEALNVISEGLGDVIYASNDMTEAINGAVTVLGEASWTDELISELYTLGDIFSDTSVAMSDIYDATVTVKENIDVYWSKLGEAGEELILALGYFSEATSNLNDSLDLMDTGLGNIIDGTEKLFNSVSINDENAVTEAAKQIGEGFNQLVDASAKGSAALSELSEALKQTEESDPSDILTALSDAISALSDAGEETTEAISKLSEGMSVILDNANIDFDSISEGGSLVFDGVSNLSDALKKMREATKALGSGMDSLSNAAASAGEAVVIKDEEKLSQALDSAYDALGEIIYSIEELSEVFGEVIETVEVAKEWGEELNSAFSEVTKAMSGISQSLIKIQTGVDSLRSNISFDTEAAELGLDMIIEGFGDMGDAAASVKETLSHLADALADLEGAADGIENAAYYLAKSIYYFEDAAKLITDMTDGINKLLGYLDGVDPIQLPTPNESIKEQAIQLFIYISAIESELKYLNSDITSLGVDLTQRIGRINELFDEMSDNVVDMIYGITDGSIVDNNVSEEEIDAVTNGKLFSCVNFGAVNGDINVGGISGAMGLEYALDPEDDLSGELSVTQKKQYMLKAVIHACKNYGSVTSKRDGAGGVCGKMDLGLIYGCESYGSVQSEAGNYVGGIAGITAGLISQSFAKCSLSGGKYVGGIVGSGVSESYSGDSSIVRNCYSMVEIQAFSQYAGAIAGANIGEYAENLFISDSLAGIDRVSYSGKAEPISYEDLIKRRSIPDDFYGFTLKFVADGETVYSTQFDYGYSFDLSNLPDVPEKDGHYGYWDNTDLNDLVFDTTVNAVYKAYVTSLGSDESRENGREIFFVEGEFTEDDKITVTSGADTSSLTLIEQLFTKDSLIESWTLTIPRDNLDLNTVHFLPTSENCRVFVKTDGVWKQVDATEFGSYLIFDVEGESVEIAIAKHTVKILPIALISSALLIAIAVVVVIIYKKKKAASAENKNGEAAEENSAKEQKAKEETIA